MLDKNPKTLIIISGGSGTGKTSVANLLAQDPKIERIITSTTRPPRQGEIDKKDYYFISKELFEEELRKGNFLEHTIYDSNYYGIHGQVIDLVLTKKKKCGVVVVDVNGVRSLKQHCLDKGYACFSFWFQAPSLENLVNNLRKRGANDKNIVDRLIVEERERQNSKEYDYVLITSDLNNTVNKIKDIVFKN